MDTTLLLFRFSMVLGIVSVVLLSCDDFRKNVRKFISRWRYYFAGFVFVAINLFIYLIVTYALIQESPAAVVFKSIISINGNYLRIWMPLLLAFIYFGAGAGSFRLGNKEIQLNQKLREALERLFNSKPLEPSDVNYAAQETGQLYAKLRKKVDKVEIVAKEKKWDELKSKVDDFKEDETVLNQEMTFLKGINEKLATLVTELDEASAAGQLTGAMHDIQERIRNIVQSMTKKAQKLLVAFAFEYYKDEAKLERFLIEIEVLNPKDGHIPNIPSIINRALILGFMFGLLIGPLFGIIRNGDPIYYCWRGSLVLMLFSACVSYGVHSGSWMRSVLVSSIGGYGAHLLWSVIDMQNLALLKQHSFEWFLNPMMYSKAIVGLSYGVTTALILYAMKFYLGPKVSNKHALYAIASLSGAVFYPLLYIAFNGSNKDSTVFLLVAGMGAIAMSSLALAVNIAKGVRAQTNVQRPPEDRNYFSGSRTRTPITQI